MESIAFEEFGIDKCRNENCNQLYNADSIKLAVWLYGVIFLHEEKQFECADPVFGPSENEKKIMDEKTNGYAGITCPKCLKTNFYKMKAREIKKFKKFLNSWSMLKKNDPDDKGQSLTWMPELISVNLRYYSPFGERSAALKDFCIHEYAYDKPIDTLEFSDDFITTILGEPKDLQGSFCSYDISDNIEPAGTYTGIYWFNEKSIAEITNDENEKKKRLFPRYHYFHDLMEKIDALLTYNYYYGQKIGQVLIDTEESMKKDLKNYEFHYLKKEDIDKRKKQIEIDFEKSGKFFGILISDPIEFNPFIREPLKNCDYFWITGDPFSGIGLPEDFSFGSYSDEDPEFSTGVRNNHKKMVELIQENFHKQYVQEFLKDNLIDFLEKYEGLLQSNTFSYAAVWELKESYLDRLHEATNQGLGLEKPFSFHYAGPGWTIRFNNNFIPGLRDSGLQYVYFLLSNPNEYFSYSDLDIAGGIDPSQCSRKGQHKLSSQGGGNNNNDKKPKKTIGVHDMMDDEGYRSFKKEKMKLEQALSEAKQNNDIPRIQIAEQKLDEFITYLQEYYISFRKTKKEFPVMEAKKRYDRIEKSISRAIKKIESHNPELYLHLAQSIHGLSNKFYRNAGLRKLSAEGSVMYKSDPNIEWHLY